MAKGGERVMGKKEMRIQGENEEWDEGERVRAKTGGRGMESERIGKGERRKRSQIGKRARKKMRGRCWGRKWWNE